MRLMFSSALRFNQPLNSWRTSRVATMAEMFKETGQGISAKIGFDHDINAWDVSSVTDMSLMFHTAALFNQPLNSWRTGAVETMDQVFACSGAFYQNISAWSTAAYTKKRDHQFQGARQDIFGSQSHFYTAAKKDGFCAAAVPVCDCTESPFSPYYGK